MRPTCPRCLCRLARAHGAVQSPRMILPESTPHARSPIPRQIRGIYTSKVDFARAALRRSIDPDTSASTSTRTSIITNRRTPPPLEGTSDGSRWDEPKDIDVVAEQTPEMGLVPEGLESWHDLNIPIPILHQMRRHYPHNRGPTPAQAGLMDRISGGGDVFCKDGTGRGKTLAVAIAALSLAYEQSLSSSTRTTVLILVPTHHLAHQVESHLENLNPDPNTPLYGRLTVLSDPATTSSRPTTPIILCTPKEFLSYPDYPNLYPDIGYIFLDEPDTMIGVLPARYVPSGKVKKERVNRHVPPIATVLNAMLSIEAKGIVKGELEIDFSKRRPGVSTIWTSATMSSQFRRFVKTRGWVRRGEECMELDYTLAAGEKQVRVRDEIMAKRVVNTKSGSLDPEKGFDVTAKEPAHYVLTVSPQGDINSLSNTPSSPRAHVVDEHRLIAKVPAELIESLALLHSTHPPPTGTYALAVPPEGVSMDKLSDELVNLGIPSFVLTPDLLSTLSSNLDRQENPAYADLPSPPIFIARRSAVPGLHLPLLHTIYLINGLDLGGMTEGQKKNRMALREREKFYDILAGRVGRLGTGAGMGMGGEGEGEGERQRVISLVCEGGEEEVGLREIFFGDDGDGVGRGRLERWDLEGMEKRIRGVFDGDSGMQDGQEIGERDRIA